MSLEHFAYEYGLCENTDVPWEPKGIMKGLMENFAHSLVTLELYEGLPWEASDPYSDPRFVGSLRDFQVSKTLTVDNMMFIEDIKDDENPLPLLSRVPRIAELLPHSLESLTLRGEFEDGVAVEMLRGFPQRKARRFPNLEKVKFEYRVEIERRLKEDFEKASITLK